MVVLGLGLVLVPGLSSHAAEFPYNEKVLTLAIEKWPLRDGAEVGALSDYFCDSAIYQPHVFFLAMEAHPKVFAEWLTSIELSFTDFGDGQCFGGTKVLECRRSNMLEAMSRLAPTASYAELIRRLRERLFEIEIRTIE